MVKRIAIRDIKQGQRFWECSGQGNFEFEADSDAVEENGVISVNAHSVKARVYQRFSWNTGFPAYEIALYDGPAYVQTPWRLR